MVRRYCFLTRAYAHIGRQRLQRKGYVTREPRQDGSWWIVYAARVVDGKIAPIYP